jgi:hypothetical protein
MLTEVVDAVIGIDTHRNSHEVEIAATEDADQSVDGVSTSLCCLSD